MNDGRRCVDVDWRSSSRRSVRAPTSWLCSCSSLSSDWSSSRRSSTTPSACSSSPAVGQTAPASRPSRSDCGGRSWPWRRSATATCVRARTSACWSGRSARCSAFSRSTYRCRSSSTTSDCSTRTRRRALSYQRSDDACWFPPGTRRQKHPQTVLGVASTEKPRQSSARGFGLPSRLFWFFGRPMPIGASFSKIQLKLQATCAFRFMFKQS